MKWTHEHRELRRTARAIIDADINPHCDEWEAAGIFPAHQVMKKMADAGLLGLSKPEAYGGMALDYSYEIALAEELGNIRAGGVSTAIGVQTNMCTPALARHGSDALCRQFLAPTIAGDLVGCIGVSEVGAGSDVASIKTTARKDGGDYVINGSKMWITNGVQGDWICLLANTDTDGAPHHNKSLIIVPLKTKGVSVARKLDKLGLHCSDTAQLFFDDVRVPQANRIGDENRGFIYQMQQFQEERLYAAARSLRALELVVEDTVEYTGQRQAFGRSILDNQVVHFKMAEFQSRIEAIRALLYQAVETYIDGGDVSREASMAKYLVGQLAMELPSQCLQYWGGQGYMNESPVSRAFRDTRLVAVGGGANEVMLQVICKHMGILPGNR
ncbi:MAG: acyl-CoA dehydrogenase family protein [Hyphomicrobiales bacterium]|nr:acyl-CoA dehydrogenase family protein [Hyphomicrobiales bacterium]MCP5374102.1 acyl-CoA dehydrogenase family protein [Hyphomicrobiales bacterium]